MNDSENESSNTENDKGDILTADRKFRHG